MASAWRSHIGSSSMLWKSYRTALSSHAASIAEEQPEKLAKLRGDIELVTLEALIKRYEEMLGEKLVEGRWQDFFNENPFILNMAFGYPVIKVRDQASVGGRKLSGEGEKITDFLVKNSLTNNTAIFEIKTPQTAILNKTPFREGVFTPSTDLSGSINQALDQKYQFQKQVAQIKDNTRLYDIESYAVHCCLVIGKTPNGEDRKKSFELFRRNSKDVEIVTFDELLEKGIREIGEYGENRAAKEIADEGGEILARQEPLSSGSRGDLIYRGRDGTITCVECKAGKTADKARLSPRQRQTQSAIDSGQVVMTRDGTIINRYEVRRYAIDY